MSLGAEAEEVILVGGGAAIADRALAFIEQNRDEPSVLAGWKHRNRESLRLFWGARAGRCACRQA